MSNEYGTAATMNTDEKQISFLNRFFVFRKATRVNAEKVFKLHMKRDIELPVTSAMIEPVSSRKINIKASKGKRVTILSTGDIEVQQTSVTDNIPEKENKADSVEKKTEPQKKIFIKIKKPTTK